MKKLISNSMLLLMPFMLTACGASTATKESAAKIPVQTDASLGELRQSAKTLFNGREIAISASAFSESNRLLIQRKPVRLPSGQVIDTGVDEPPFVLELFLRDGECYLRNKATGEEVRLVEVGCEAK